MTIKVAGPRPDLLDAVQRPHGQATRIRRTSPGAGPQFGSPTARLLNEFLAVARMFGASAPKPEASGYPGTELAWAAADGEPTADHIESIVVTTSREVHIVRQLGSASAPVMSISFDRTSTTVAMAERQARASEEVILGIFRPSR